MLGTKRTIPFWRPKRRLLNVERALAPDHPAGAQAALKAQAIAAARVRNRLAVVAKKKARFVDR